MYQQCSSTQTACQVLLGVRVRVAVVPAPHHKLGLQTEQLVHVALELLEPVGQDALTGGAELPVVSDHRMTVVAETILGHEPLHGLSQAKPRIP